MPGEWSGRLRQRAPARRDKELVAIYEGLGGCEELLRRVALLAVTAPPRYMLRIKGFGMGADGSRSLRGGLRVRSA